MLRMSVVFALLVLAWLPAAAAAASQCNLAHVQKCGDTNDLVGTKGFEPAVKAFLGPQQVAFLYKTAPLSRQMIDVLHGPPDKGQHLPNGNLLFAACRAHSCFEKGAIVINTKGRILAMAIVSYHVGATNQFQLEPHFLDVYVCPDTKATTRNAMRRWGARAVAEDAAADLKYFHDTDVAQRTTIHVLHTPACTSH